MFATAEGGKLSQLSDEVLMMILRYLPPTDLCAVMSVCRRLNRLCHERGLWTSIEGIKDRRVKLELALSSLLSSKTTKVTLRGELHPTNKGYRSSLPPSLAQKLLENGKTLTELYLVNQKWDGKYFNLTALPPTLKILNLSSCVVDNLGDNYLRDIGLRLSVLEELDLSHSSFVTGHSLMALSKLPKLKKLRLRGCRKVGECLAYVGLSCRFGFQTLKVLDVTDTGVGSTEFVSFAGLKGLEEFLFGQYDSFVDHEHNYITDLCLTRLRAAPHLRKIDMSGSRVTDRVLEVLESIPNLEKVDAHFTFLSDEGVAKFHQQRPNCQLEITSEIVSEQ